MLINKMKVRHFPCSLSPSSCTKFINFALRFVDDCNDKDVDSDSSRLDVDIEGLFLSLPIYDIALKRLLFIDNDTDNSANSTSGASRKRKAAPSPEHDASLTKHTKQTPSTGPKRPPKPKVAIEEKARQPKAKQKNQNCGIHT